MIQGAPTADLKHRPPASPTRSRVTENLESQIWEALSRIHDPEMPVSLVTMGMVYRVDVADHVAEIDLTFTSIGCPAWT